jgi:hypothetical protein
MTERGIDGPRNPYAIAELKRGEIIDWENTSSGKRKQILEDTFARKYERLFSPEFDSPLYGDLKKTFGRERQ